MLVASASRAVAGPAAVTYRPLAGARRATYPLPRSTRSNCSQSPPAVRLATSGAAPPLSAVTYPPLACARIATTVPVPETVQVKLVDRVPLAQATVALTGYVP